MKKETETLCAETELKPKGRNETERILDNKALFSSIKAKKNRGEIEIKFNCASNLKGLCKNSPSAGPQERLKRRRRRTENPEEKKGSPDLRSS